MTKKKRKPPKRVAAGDLDAAMPPETAKRFIGELRSELGAWSQLAKEREADARERFEERARRAGPPGESFSSEQRTIERAHKCVSAYNHWKTGQVVSRLIWNGGSPPKVVG